MAGKLVQVSLAKYQIVDGGSLVLEVSGDWSNDEVKKAVAASLDRLGECAEWGEQTSKRSFVELNDINEFEEINLEEDTSIHQLSKFTSDTQSQSPDELTAHKCPQCGENRKAHLVWQGDEMLLCESCGHTYLAREDVCKLASSLFNLFASSSVPDDFSYNGQSLFDRCEGWLRHAIEQLETEIQDFTECGRDPRQSPGECPQCNSDRVALACCVNGHEFYHCDECSENGRLAVVHGAKNRFSCPYCDDQQGDEEKEEAENV